ncbi:hypothetical protein [Neisseria sp. Ec49-e6-T10]|uniref:hypothetical protein n=1 Tax=Neisseria sp. Ec49-e6-T10 TaxID=3140744 RepID=UPI003EC13E1E
MNKPSAFFPLVLIAIGGLWLLNILDLLPATSTLFAAIFMVIGVLIFIMDGFNKSSIVAGPFLMYCGVGIYLNHQESIRLSVILAAGMVVLGLCLLLARASFIPYKNERRVAKKRDADFN